MIKQNFRVEKVSERVTRIYAFSSELMYLVEGEKESALLDSGSGIGFVRPTIEKLTQKPLKILLTHGHVDHSMGASEFPAENVFINQEDEYIYKPHSSWEFRRDGLFLMDGGENVTDEDFTPIVPIENYNDLKEGKIFNLGGISVEIFACPGHTKGSLIFYLPEENIILLGDACNANTFLFEDYSTSIETYLKSLERIKKILGGKFEIALASHGDGKLVKEIIDENILLSKKILEGTAEKIPLEFRGHKGFIAKKNSVPHHGNIVYNPEKIFEEE